MRHTIPNFLNFTSSLVLCDISVSLSVSICIFVSLDICVCLSVSMSLYISLSLCVCLSVCVSTLRLTVYQYVPLTSVTPPLSTWSLPS